MASNGKKPIDPRDADAPEWNHRRYKQNRLALRGFRRVLEVVDRYMQTARYNFNYFDKAAYAKYAAHVSDQSYRLVDELAQIGALDLIGVGISVENAEAIADQERRRKPRP